MPHMARLRDRLGLWAWRIVFVPVALVVAVVALVSRTKGQRPAARPAPDLPPRAQATGDYYRRNT